jgi:hypothetical protein
MYRLHFALNETQERRHQSQRRYIETPDLVKSDKGMKPSQIAVVENQPHSTPHLQIEVQEHIFKRLSDLANKEQIPLKLLVSELLREMLLFHKREVQKIVEKLKCHGSK